MNKTEELLTTEDVAALLKIPTETVRYWHRLDRGPKGFKIGRHVRYRSTDVHAWVDQQATR